MDKKWETSGLHDTHFHSSRKERHEAGGIAEKKEKKGFFQKNPSFKIIMIDILFIVIISGVIVPFIYKREGTSTIDNYKLTLKAFDFDDEVMFSLTVIEKDDTENASLVESEFYLNVDGLTLSESDLLPGPGEERILKGGLPLSDEKYLYCKVSINGKNKIIKKKIK